MGTGNQGGVIVGLRGRVRPLPQVPLELPPEPEPKECVEAQKLTTRPCIGCGEDVVVAQYGGRLLVLDPKAKVFVWLGTKKDGSPRILSQPTNWLAEHQCHAERSETES
jgi:hypothetical protein